MNNERGQRGVTKSESKYFNTARMMDEALIAAFVMPPGAVDSNHLVFLVNRINYAIAAADSFRVQIRVRDAFF